MKTKIWLLLIFAILFSINANSARAQVKSYSYNAIDVAAKINKDTTFDITEKQTFDFTGEFHEAWREIPLAKIDSISDIKVVDAQTGEALQYTSSTLDKTLPSSWGKYTLNRENGNQNIIWYYSAKNEKKTWILRYKVHGGLEFGTENDRFYWNIFTNYKVPIQSASVLVQLPDGIEKNGVLAFGYRNSLPRFQGAYDKNKNEVSYNNLANFSAGEMLTVDISWPKGVVDRGAYWEDYAKSHYGYLAAIISLIVCFIIGLAFWLKKEKFAKGKGTIIPEYEPPMHLKPAMAEIIVKEKLTNKGLAATIIDLAVRGRVKISEEDNKTRRFLGKYEKIFPIFKSLLFYFTAGVIICIYLFPVIISPEILKIMHVVLIILVSIIAVVGLAGAFNSQRDYLIELVRINHPESDTPEDYEKEYLKILFSEKETFSTKELRSAGDSKKIKFSKGIKELIELIYKETDKDTQAFEINPIYEYKIKKILAVILFLPIIIYFILVSDGVSVTITIQNQLVVAIIGIVIPIFFLWLFMRYEARLNKQGLILKEEWLGFKLYLEVAEKYRMQNLTPELFEKYLPYAIIFGVEKKWAKAFEKISMPEPNWYHGSSSGGFVSGSSGTGSSFSPSSFSTSFSSSFSSAFASSGASGGSAGGGGGGGGGGAS